MQKPNFPSAILRVTLTPGRWDEGPKAIITSIPARFSEKTVATINGRRIAMEKMGKVETVAESYGTMIYRAWCRSQSEALVVIGEMHQKMAASVQKKLESLRNMQASLAKPYRLQEDEYVPD